MSDPRRTVFTDGLKITDGLIIMLPVIEEFERRQARSETVFVLLYASVSVPMGCFFLVHAHWACMYSSCSPPGL